MNISGTTMHITDLTIDGESIKDLKSKLSRIYINNAGAHNSLYRGKNLGTSITAAQIANIQNGSFDDIYPGDYWVFSIDGSTVYAYVAGCDLYWFLGSAMLRDHHIVLWCQFTKDYNINDTATLEGGFAGSKLYTQTFPYLISELEKVIPAANFKTLYDFIPDAFNSDGTPSHMVEDRNMKMFLPTINNVSGNSSGRSIYYFAGTVTWPLARLNPPSVNRWTGYWLGSAASSTMWHIKSLQGMTQTTNRAVNGASENMGKCWPYILVG